VIWPLLLIVLEGGIFTHLLYSKDITPYRDGDMRMILLPIPTTLLAVNRRVASSNLARGAKFLNSIACALAFSRFASRKS